MQGKYNKCISCGNNRVDKMASVPLAGVSNEDVYSAELGAFDYYYNKMKLYVNPATMQGTLLREGLVDGSVIRGGAAVFLPDHVKMEELLSQVRQSIALNRPPNLDKLIRALRGVTTYQSLASDINEKYMELLDKARSEARVDKNTAKDHGVSNTEVQQLQQPQQEQQLEEEQQPQQQNAQTAANFTTTNETNLVKKDELKAMVDKKSFKYISSAEAKQFQSQTQILLVTANKQEYNAVLALLEPLPDFQALFNYKHIFKFGEGLSGKDATYTFGKFGAFNAAVQMMVTQGPSSAQDVVTIAANCFGHGLYAIFAVGVACGVEHKTNYLDVLVSKSISFYGADRRGTAENGELDITSRATANMPTSTFFLDYFNQPPDWPTKIPEWQIDSTKTVKRLTTKPKVRKGNILSGGHLVDNKGYKEWLLKEFAREAIGIEMEGAGLYHDYRSHNYEILVVKAVCDFGDGKKNKEYQPTAALLAAECLHHYLDNDTMPDALQCKKGHAVSKTEEQQFQQPQQEEQQPEKEEKQQNVQTSATSTETIATADKHASSDADNKFERDGVNPQPNGAAFQHDPVQESYGQDRTGNHDTVQLNIDEGAHRKMIDQLYMDLEHDGVDYRRLYRSFRLSIEQKGMIENSKTSKMYETLAQFVEYKNPILSALLDCLRECGVKNERIEFVANYNYT